MIKENLVYLFNDRHLNIILSRKSKCCRSTVYALNYHFNFLGGFLNGLTLSDKNSRPSVS